MVEKSGQTGLQSRTESGEPSMPRRREDFRVDEQDESGTVAQKKESIAEEFQARKNSILVDEIVPETAVETPPPGADKQLGEGKQNAAESSNGNGETTKPVTSAGGAIKKGVAKGGLNGNSKPAKSTDKPTTLKPITRPAAISTGRTSVASKASPRTARTPVPRTPTTPSQSRPRDTPTKGADNKATKKTTAPTSKPTAQSSTMTRNPAPKAKVSLSPPQTGFVKPKPRSPTRPVKLPPSLTAHTASSGSKLANAPPVASRQTSSRASGTIPSSATQSRSPSVSKSSGRPSLGPPPATLKKQPSRQSLPTQNAPAPDSFLARMMRPTTSSAAKTLDKSEVPQATNAQPARKPVVRESASKPRATPAAGSAAQKTNNPTPSTKLAARETKNVVDPIKKAAPKLAAKAAPEEITEHGHETPVPAAEPAVPVSTEALEGPGVVEDVSVGADVVPEPDVEQVEAKATEHEAPKTESVEDLSPIEIKHIEDVEGAKPVESAESAESVEPVELIEKVEVAQEIPAVADTDEVKEAKEETTPEEVEAKGVKEDATPQEIRTEDIKEGASKEVENARAESTQEARNGELESVPVTKAEEAKSQEPEVAATPALPSVEDFVEPAPKPKPTKPIVEDPEDVKAREEVARLNAQISNASDPHEAKSDNEVD